MKEQRKKCPKCGNMVKILSRDHVIPQLFFKIAKNYPTIKLPWAMNSPKNIEMVCLDCNGDKGSKLEGELGKQFLTILRKGLIEYEDRGGYVPAIHKSHWRRFSNTIN